MSGDDGTRPHSEENFERDAPFEFEGERVYKFRIRAINNRTGQEIKTTVEAPSKVVAKERAMEQYDRKLRITSTSKIKNSRETRVKNDS